MLCLDKYQRSLTSLSEMAIDKQISDPEKS